MIWSSTLSKNVIAAAVTFLVLFKATAQAAALPLHAGSVQKRRLEALDYLPFHGRPTSTASDDNDKTYTPPAACQDACNPLIEALDQCEDDSCICSQSGIDALFECAACDTRLATKQAKFNAKETLTDLKDICQLEGYTVGNITLPARSDYPVAATMSSNVPASAVHLSSVAYASLSIHSEGGISATDQGLSSAMITPIRQEATGTAVKKESRYLTMMTTAIIAFAIAISEML